MRQKQQRQRDTHKDKTTPSPCDLGLYIDIVLALYRSLGGSVIHLELQQLASTHLHHLDDKLEERAPLVHSTVKVEARSKRPRGNRHCQVVWL